MNVPEERYEAAKWCLEKGARMLGKAKTPGIDVERAE
jgi:hypothetical protein